MAEILFYHLTESTLDEALPGLVERSITRGWRVVIQAVTEERRDALDSLLWTFSDTSFVAHGTDHEPLAEHQPVLLTTSQANLNGATVRFLVEGAALEDASPYDRLVVMFDGHNQEQLENARAQWKTFKMGNHDLTYWQQTTDRRWERKA
ncbi:DNA polymerase III subunit chi [Ochrobactrum chromiisoli]|uniref:DNA polymerase III subunit chi n=1 Tax=Ochrobactrum chromiisoli TaxID=2993941 RepID=A0ABT3QKD6_9HYPH|nr:DNA polymerase III subunit chi [Ochrobactrum chromiisoli]MCX2696074.1 DNA polymerase III subunit chi [Ochrobactrum chromiisoli]